MSCGSLHQLGEEQLKPPPLPPRRKDAMSEAKVRAPTPSSISFMRWDGFYSDSVVSSLCVS